jgi:hypothetical protein
MPRPDRLRLARGNGELAKVDVAEAVLRRVDTRGGGPHNTTVAPDGTVVAALWASDRIVIFRDGERTFVELGGAPHDVKIARNIVVVANPGDGARTARQPRRDLPQTDPPQGRRARPGDRPE